MTLAGMRMRWPSWIPAVISTSSVSLLDKTALAGALVRTASSIFG